MNSSFLNVLRLRLSAQLDSGPTIEEIPLSPIDDDAFNALFDAKPSRSIQNLAIQGSSSTQLIVNPITTSVQKPPEVRNANNKRTNLVADCVYDETAFSPHKRPRIERSPTSLSSQQNHINISTQSPRSALPEAQ